MAVNIFEMFGKIGADDKPAMDAIDRVVGHARTANNTLSNGLSSMGSFFTGVGDKLTATITKPAVGAASALTGITLVKGFNRLVGIDEAKAKLLGLGHDAQGVEVIMKSALESVKGTSFGMDEAATTAANAVAAGIEPGQELTKYLKLTGDAAAIAGVSMSEMGSIMNKVTTGGKAMTENLEQLSDRGLPVYQWLAKEAGVAADQVKDLASSGKISAEMFRNAIEHNIGGAAAIIGENSFKASLANMWASVGRIGANFLDAGGKGGGFFSQLKPLIGEATSLLSSLEAKAADFGAKFGESFKKVIDFVMELKGKFDSLSPAMQQATLKSAGMGTAFAVGIGPALQIFGKFTTALAPVAKAFETMNLGLDLASDKAKAVFSGMGSGIEGFKNKLSSGTGKVGEFSQVLKNLGSGGVNVVSKVIPDSALSKIDSLKEKMSGLSPVFDRIGSGFGTVASQFGSMASGMIGQLGGLATMALKLVGPGAVIGVIIAGLGLAQSQFGSQIDGFLKIATEKGPMIIEGLVQGITSKIPALMQQGTTLITNFLEAVTTNLPFLLQGGVDIIATLVEGLASNVGNIIPVVVELLRVFIQNIIISAPRLLEAGLTLLMALIDGIVDNLPQIIDAIVTLTTLLISQIAASLPMLVEAGIKILVALVQGITQAIPQLLEAIPVIWQALKNGFASIDWKGLGKQVLDGIEQGLAMIGNMFAKIFEPLTSWANKKGEEISNGFKKAADKSKTAWKGTKEYFKDVSDGIKQGFDNTITWFEGLPAWFGQKWEETKAIFFEAVGAIKTIIDENFGWIYPYIEGVFNGLQTYFSGVWEVIKNIFLAPILLILTFFTQGFDQMKNTASQIMQNILEGLSQVWEGIKQVFSNSVGAIITYVVEGFLKMLSEVATKMGQIYQAASEKWDALLAWMGALPGRLWTSVTTAWDSALKAITAKLTEIYNTVVAKWNAALEWMSGLPGRIWTAVTNAWDKAVKAVTDKLTEVYNTVSKKWKEAIDFLSSIDLLQIGRDVMQGFLNGITEKATAIWDKAKEIANGVRSKIEGVLDINSPSRVMRAIGLYTGDGLVLGLEDSKTAVEHAMESIANIVSGTNLDMADVGMSGITTQGVQGSNVSQILASNNEQVLGLLGNVIDVLYALLQKDQHTYLDGQQLVDGMKRKMSVALNRMNEQQSINNGIVPKPT